MVLSHVTVLPSPLFGIVSRAAFLY
jgi:hypothetical protein